MRDGRRLLRVGVGLCLAAACASSSPGSGGSGGAGGRTEEGGSPGAGGAPAGSGGSSVTGGTSGTGGVQISSGGSRGSGGAPAGSGGSSGGGGEPAGGQAGTSAGGTAGQGAAGATGSGAAGTSGLDPCPAAGACKILPLGDSITAGAGAQPGDGGGYRTELFTKAVADNKHITFVGSLTGGPTTVAGMPFPKNHEGHIGWTIDQISAIASTAQTVTVSGKSNAGALRDMPHIVLLFIGTNDEGYTSSEPGASDRLGQLIDKITAALPNTLLVVSSIYPFPGCTASNCAAAVTAYDAAVPGVIKQRADQGKHILYVDMSTLPASALSTDGVHPNDTVGYPWMGDNWYAVIKRYLR